jgi:hypothetical protein
MVMKMSEFDGIIGQVGKCNAKDIPLPNSSHTEVDITKSLASLVTQILLIQDTTLNHSTKQRNDSTTLHLALKTATTMTDTHIKNVIGNLHNACHSAIDTTQYYTNIDDVLFTKKATKSMVISALDKADSTLVALCPVAYHRKIMAEMMACPNLTNITASTCHTEIMKKITENYRRIRLSHKFKPSKGKIPNSYIKPKSKDPVNKNRVITSYYNFPMKRLLKLASKALTHCLRNLNKKHRHFTLHRLSDTKNLIRKMEAKFKKKYGTTAHVETYATDLEQMYTNLDHAEIKKATLWLFDKIQHSQNGTTHNGRNLRKRRTLIKVDLTSPNRAQFTTNHSVDSDCVIFTLDDLFSIIEFDLENTYTSIGNQLFKQHKGCPMGGLLSSFYANTTCAYHENTYLSTNPLAPHMWGIRQMDDLTLFVAHTAGDPSIHANNASILWQVKNHVYKGGLKAEIQEPEMDTDDKYIHKFAGHEIHTHKDLSRIYTTTLNDNKTSIHEGYQKKVRYPDMYTYTNQHTKIGNIIGSIHRIRTQNTYREDFNEAMEDLILELQCIHYSPTMIKKCIYKLARQESWKIMLNSNIRTLTQHLKPHNTNTNTHSKVRTTPNKHQQRESDSQV